MIFKPRKIICLPPWVVLNTFISRTSHGIDRGRLFGRWWYGVHYMGMYTRSIFDSEWHKLQALSNNHFFHHPHYLVAYCCKIFLQGIWKMQNLLWGTKHNVFKLLELNLSMPNYLIYYPYHSNSYYIFLKFSTIFNSMNLSQ